LGGLDEQFPWRREPHSGSPVENLIADEIFNPANDLTHARLAYVQTFGGATEVAFLGNHEQHGQLGQE
jgi:hypothetical protein